MQKKANSQPPHPSPPPSCRDIRKWLITCEPKTFFARSNSPRKSNGLPSKQMRLISMLSFSPVWDWLLCMFQIKGKQNRVRKIVWSKRKAEMMYTYNRTFLNNVESSREITCIQLLNRVVYLLDSYHKNLWFRLQGTFMDIEPKISTSRFTLIIQATSPVI